MHKQQLTASIVAPSVMVLNMKNATQYPKRGDVEAAVGVIMFLTGVLLLQASQCSMLPILICDADGWMDGAVK
jgi:hypothetical protein